MGGKPVCWGTDRYGGLGNNESCVTAGEPCLTSAVNTSNLTSPIPAVQLSDCGVKYRHIINQRHECSTERELNK